MPGSHSGVDALAVKSSPSLRCSGCDMVSDSGFFSNQTPMKKGKGKTLKILLILILALSASSVFAQGKNKDSSVERAIRDEIGGDNKGGGKPSNPGAHGRANAASKSGGGVNSGSGSLLGDIIDEIDDDDREDDREDRKSDKNKGGKGKK